MEAPGRGAGHGKERGLIMGHVGSWWFFVFLFPLFFAGPWWGYRRRSWRVDRDSDPRDRQRPVRAEELDEAVRLRLEAVDQLETRVAELENRLDFTERLLAQRTQSAEAPASIRSSSA